MTINDQITSLKLPSHVPFANSPLNSDKRDRQNVQISGPSPGPGLKTTAVTNTTACCLELRNGSAVAF